MNKILIIFLTIFLVIGLISGAYAQETETDTTIDDTENGGIASDSPFHGLDRALERISLALTFNKAAKAKKGLENAKERLLEAKKLAKEGKFDKLEKARKEHKEEIEKIKQNLDLVAEENPNEALDNELAVEAELEKQENEFENVETVLDLKVVGKLNDEQLAKLKEFLSSVKDGNAQIKLRVNDHKLKIKAKLKEQGKTDEEVEAELKKLEEKHKLKEVKKEVAQHAIERLEHKLAKLKEITQKQKENGKDVTLMEQRLTDVEVVLTQIKTKLSQNDLVKIRDLIKSAEQMLNFREVFRSAENPEKLRQLESEKNQERDNLKTELKRLKEAKESKEEPEKSKRNSGSKEDSE